MNSYSEIEVFSIEELAFWRQATDMVAKLEGAREPSGLLIRCHELARAVGEVLKLRVQDGHYGLVEHSWIWVEGELGGHILDVYVPGEVPQVQLVDYPAFSLPARTINYSWPADWRPLRTAVRTDVVVWLTEIFLRKLRQ